MSEIYLIAVALACGVGTVGLTVMVLDILDILSFLPHDTWLYDMKLKHHHTMTHQEMLEEDIFLIEKQIDGQIWFINYAAYYHATAGDREGTINAICDSLAEKGVSKISCTVAFTT